MRGGGRPQGKRGSRQVTKTKKATSNNATGTRGSLFRALFEFFFFLCLLACAGIAGYFVGHVPVAKECPTTTSASITNSEIISIPAVVEKKPECVHDSPGAGMAIGALEKSYTFDEVKRLWKCARTDTNFTQINKRIYPNEKNYEKTKWKSILAVEPKAFFDKYLPQYPGDIRAIQPVVVFSHKPLSDMKDIPEVCKVIDVAVIPDTPGVCVAVTETYHDVASYHMLHADRQADGTFALTANVEGRLMPDQKAYTGARALLLEYFNHVDYVNKAARGAPRYGQNKVAVGCFLETVEELKLFKNSLASGIKVGISKSKFCVFTTSSDVNSGMTGTGVKTIYLPEIALVGTSGDAAVGLEMRRNFIQAWIAFAVSNNQIKMLWQSPGTVWRDRPDNVVNISPLVETLWSFKGRKDKRAAPFFCSFDFFVPSGAERTVHFMHEILLHFDLVLAWGSMDAVVAYRLSENNARYGTTTAMLPPYKILHTDLIGHDPERLKQAITSPEPPMAIVVPTEGLSVKDAEALLRNSGLWYSSD